MISSSSESCAALSLVLLLVSSSLVVLGMGSHVIQVHSRMEEHMEERICDTSQSITSSYTRAGVCHEASIYSVWCSPGRVFNQTVAVPVTIVFPPLRAAATGTFVCYQKDDLNLPVINTQGFLSATCDVNHYFQRDQILCYYGSYTIAGWIAGVVLSSLFWFVVCALLLAAACSHLGTRKCNW